MMIRTTTAIKMAPDIASARIKSGVIASPLE
jgi:hypothetical protein